MKALGFNISKIDAERKKPSVKDLKINTGMEISDISQIKTDIFKGKDEVVEVTFKYTVNYEPGLAKVALEGAIIVSLDQKTSKEVLKEWKKKKVPEDIRGFLYNIILSKTSLKALEIEDELNLPYHIPMPRFKKKE